MAYGADFYQAVELAVNTTGAQAVSDMDARVASLKSELLKYQAALASGALGTIDAQKQFEILAAKLNEATEAAAAGARVMGGMPAQLEATQKGAGGAARAVLELSRGFEDFTTGGFLGVLNNIPGVFQGIGQAAGLAAPHVALLTAGASALGTTAYIVYQHWGDVRKLFDDGLSPKALADVKDLTKGLKELTDKEWKTLIDVGNIDELKGKIDALSRAKAGYERLDAPDKAKKARAESITEGIVEGSKDGGGRRGFSDAVKDAVAGPMSAETRETIAKLDELEKKIAEADAKFDPLTASVHRAERDNLEASDQNRRARLETNRREDVDRKLGGAANGDEDLRKWLLGVVSANRDNFAARGLDVKKIETGLTEASPEKEREREAAKVAREVKAKADADEADRKERARNFLSSTKGGFDDKLESSFFGGIKGGGDIDKLKAAARPDLVNSLRGRRVDEDIIDRVADSILGKAADAALNKVEEGGLPKLDAKAERDAAKKTADAWTAATKRERDVADQVRRVAPGLDDALEKAALSRVERGQRIGQAADALAPQVKARLASYDVPADLQADTARAIMAKIRDSVTTAIDKETLSHPGIPLGSGAAAHNILMDRGARSDGRDGSREKHDQAQVFAAEFRARTNANPAEAARAGGMIEHLVSRGADPMVAMQQTYMTMMNEVQQYGKQLDAFNRQAMANAQGLRSAGRNARRNAMQRPQMQGDFTGY